MYNWVALVPDSEVGAAKRLESDRRGTNSCYRCLGVIPMRNLHYLVIKIATNLTSTRLILTPIRARVVLRLI